MKSVNTTMERKEPDRAWCTESARHMWAEIWKQVRWPRRGRRYLDCASAPANSSVRWRHREDTPGARRQPPGYIITRSACGFPGRGGNQQPRSGWCVGWVVSRGWAFVVNTAGNKGVRADWGSREPTAKVGCLPPSIGLLLFSSTCK